MGLGNGNKEVVGEELEETENEVISLGEILGTELIEKMLWVARDEALLSFVDVKVEEYVPRGVGVSEEHPLDVKDPVSVS